MQLLLLKHCAKSMVELWPHSW